MIEHLCHLRKKKYVLLSVTRKCDCAPTHKQVRTAVGNPLTVKGTFTLHIQLGNVVFQQDFVATNIEKTLGILGINSLYQIDGDVQNPEKSSKNKQRQNTTSHDFSILHTTLSFYLIKEKLTNSFGSTFQREGSPSLACNDRNALFKCSYLSSNADICTFDANIFIKWM